MESRQTRPQHRNGAFRAAGSSAPRKPTAPEREKRRVRGAVDIDIGRRWRDVVRLASNAVSEREHLPRVDRFCEGHTVLLPSFQLGTQREWMDQVFRRRRGLVVAMATSGSRCFWVQLAHCPCLQRYSRHHRSGLRSATRPRMGYTDRLLATVSQSITSRASYLP